MNNMYSKASKLGILAFAGGIAVWSLPVGAGSPPMKDGAPSGTYEMSRPEKGAPSGTYETNRPMPSGDQILQNEPLSAAPEQPPPSAAAPAEPAPAPAEDLPWWKRIFQ